MTEQKNVELDQYLTFTLGKEFFALNICSVKEILDKTDTTAIPSMPEYIRGVLNVRGHAVPIIDMRLKLGMSRTELTVDTCVINVEIDINEKMSQMGLMIDSVQEVIELGPNEISPAPNMGAGIDNRFIAGMAKCNERFVIILDTNRLVSSEDLGGLANTAEDVEEAEAGEEPVPA